MCIDEVKIKSAAPTAKRPKPILKRCQLFNMSIIGGISSKSVRQLRVLWHRARH